ncbi:MAG TPA: ABC transporter permease, partial [Alphaproteobacteria bacterium]|nr:ABC transporter permease [Alphaproteobacteria bacterium]
IFTSAVVVGTMFLFALVPALINSHPHLTLVLKDQESIAGFHKSRLRQMLVAGQIGLSLVLLMSAVLLIKSLNHILDGPGFETTRIACLRVSPVRLAYTPEKSQAFLREVLRRVEAAPEVEHVSMGQSMPWWLPKPFEVALPGRTASREEDKVMASMNAVTPGYFQTMGIPLLQGRDFTAADVSNAGNVTVINESLANRLWQHQNPLGRVMVVANEQFTVIAVARDAQYRSIADKQQPFFYTSYWQEANGTDGRLYIRSKVIPEAVLQRIHKIIVGVDPDVPITEETSMTEGVRRSFDSVLLTRNVLSAAGTIALVLSMIGLYAVIAFAVAQRTREIGIRSALGAPRNNILYLILREGFGLALLGTVMGVSGTVGLVRLLSSLMYGVSAFDVITFTAVPLLVITLAALASYIPALNATRISPLIAIRHD